MAVPLSPVVAVLGPTNTGKTHLAVERMMAHSSGMIGFPLRLLAREIYDRVVAAKGADKVALITGEERIEPPGARWYLCTVEAMPVTRDFAFVALDEAQLGADPERGHIFTDRFLRARGRDETMILGAETLRPIIRALLPDAEIITRPRFSTLSYAGTTKLSRLPKRSAIVAFSVEQVYAVAEMLRRMVGGAAVVMGALSPRTRNAQVAMFQAGEVDYLVATDAVGMGLNLDVAHVAFAGLSKFDGTRRRRLTVAEMAQIAGRAGRHQRDGTFGTLAGKDGDPDATFAPEEIEAIEGHRFPPLDTIFWRNGSPRMASIATLVSDLEQKPALPRLRPAPRAIDLSVLKLLADDPAVERAATGQVGRLWAAASLPDFRQTGAEHHSRFVAGLWRHLGHGDRRLPFPLVAAELARLDTIQGDVDVIAGRIAATRTWSYVAERADWVHERVELAKRAHALEQKLSDALHEGLKQRFVDRRTSMLLKRIGADASQLPVTLDEGRVLVDGEPIGRLEGFRFIVEASARAEDHRLLLNAAQRHLGGIMADKAQAAAAAGDADFALAPDASGRPVIRWQEADLGVIEPGRGYMSPVFKPNRALNGLEGADLKAVVERAERWIAAQLERHLGGVIALAAVAADAATPGPVRALAIQLAERGGIAPRADLAEAIAAIDKDARGAARKAGIVFGALDIFHHAAVKPGAALWRTALSAAKSGAPMASLPPGSAVHLTDFAFRDAGAMHDAGYRRIGGEYIRVDLAERVVKKTHEARVAAGGGDFPIDPMLATSLGLSETGLDALLRDAGFRKLGERPLPVVVTTEAETPPTGVALVEPVGEGDPTAAETAEVEAIVATTEPPVEPSPELPVEPQPDPEMAAADVATDQAPEPAAVPTAIFWRFAGMRRTSEAPARDQRRPARPNKAKRDAAPVADQSAAPRPHPPRRAPTPPPPPPPPPATPPRGTMAEALAALTRRD